jgi:hypothetical protein
LKTRGEIACLGGLYRITHVPEGTYTLRAIMPGFVTVIVKHVQVTKAKGAIVPFKMNVGLVR